MAQGSGGRREASVEGLGCLAIPRFVDDTVNRFSPAVGYRNHSERDKCRTQKSTHTDKDATNAHTSHVDCLYKDITGQHIHTHIHTPVNTTICPPFPRAAS